MIEQMLARGVWLIVYLLAVLALSSLALRLRFVRPYSPATGRLRVPFVAGRWMNVLALIALASYAVGVPARFAPPNSPVEPAPGEEEKPEAGRVKDPEEELEKQPKKEAVLEPEKTDDVEVPTPLTPTPSPEPEMMTLKLYRLQGESLERVVPMIERSAPGLRVETEDLPEADSAPLAPCVLRAPNAHRDLAGQVRDIVEQSGACASVVLDEPRDGVERLELSLVPAPSAPVRIEVLCDHNFREMFRDQLDDISERLPHSEESVKLIPGSRAQIGLIEYPAGLRPFALELERYLANGMELSGVKVAAQPLESSEKISVTLKWEDERFEAFYAAVATYARDLEAKKFASLLSSYAAGVARDTLTESTTDSLVVKHEGERGDADHWVRGCLVRGRTTRWPVFEVNDRREVRLWNQTLTWSLTNGGWKIVRAVSDYSNEAPGYFEVAVQGPASARVNTLVKRLEALHARVSRESADSPVSAHQVLYGPEHGAVALLTESLMRRSGFRGQIKLVNSKERSDDDPSVRVLVATEARD